MFGRTDDTKITSPIATIGIRGTGCYIDVQKDRAYTCVCYGRADLISTPSGRVLETVDTSRHDEPRYVYPAGAPKLITSAPVIDHGDAELRLLESIVNRSPPFDDNNLEDRY